MRYFFTAGSPTVEERAREVAKLLEAVGMPYLVVVRSTALTVLTGPGKAEALALITELQAGALATVAAGLVTMEQCT